MSDSDSATKQKGLPEDVKGLPPLNLDTCNKDAIPANWDIVGVMGDILMCQFVDEADDGDLMREGVYVPKGMIKYLWRVAKVLKIGPASSGNIKVDDYVMIPSDKGIPGVTKDGKKLIFLNEQRVFAVVVPREE